MKNILLLLALTFSISAFSQEGTFVRTEVDEFPSTGDQRLVYKAYYQDGAGDTTLISVRYPTPFTISTELTLITNFANNYDPDPADPNDWIIDDTDNDCTVMTDGESIAITFALLVDEGCTNLLDDNGDTFTFTGTVVASDFENVTFTGGANNEFTVTEGWWILLQSGTLTKNGGTNADFRLTEN